VTGYEVEAVPPLPRQRRAAVLDFLQTTYEAAATLELAWDPGPGQSL